MPHKDKLFVRPNYTQTRNASSCPHDTTSKSIRYDYAFVCVRTRIVQRTHHKCLLFTLTYETCMRTRCRPGGVVGDHSQRIFSCMCVLCSLLVHTLRMFASAADGLDVCERRQRRRDDANQSAFEIVCMSHCWATAAAARAAMFVRCFSACWPPALRTDRTSERSRNRITCLCSSFTGCKLFIYFAHTFRIRMYKSNPHYH